MVSRPSSSSPSLARPPWPPARSPRLLRRYVVVAHDPGSTIPGLQRLTTVQKISAPPATPAPASDADPLIGEDTAKAIEDWVKYLDYPEVGEHDDDDAAEAATSSVDPLDTLSPLPFKYFPEQDLPLLKIMLSAKKQWRDEEDAAVSRVFNLAPRNLPSPTELSMPRGAHEWDLQALKKALEFVRAEEDGSLDAETMMEAFQVYLAMKRRLDVFAPDTHLSKRHGDAPTPPATTPAPPGPVPTTSPSTLPTTTTPTIAEILDAASKVGHTEKHILEHAAELFSKLAEDEATAVPPLVTLSPQLASEISRLPVEAQVAVSSMLKHNSETAFYPSTSDSVPLRTTVTATYATEYDYEGDFYPSTSNPNPPTKTVMATFTDPALNTPRPMTAYSPSASTFVTVATKASESGESDWPITGYIPANSFYPVKETNSHAPEKLARNAVEAASSTTERFWTTIPPRSFYPVVETDSPAPASDVVESIPTSESFSTTFQPAAETDVPEETIPSPTTPFRTTIPPNSFYPVAETDSPIPANTARGLPLVSTNPQTAPFATYIPAASFYDYPPQTATPDPLKLARDVEKTPAPAPTKFVTLTHDPKFDNPRATIQPAPDSYGSTDESQVPADMWG